MDDCKLHFTNSLLSSFLSSPFPSVSLQSGPVLSSSVAPPPPPLNSPSLCLSPGKYARLRLPQRRRLVGVVIYVIAAPEPQNVVSCKRTEVSSLHGVNVPLSTQTHISCYESDFFFFFKSAKGWDAPLSDDRAASRFELWHNHPLLDLSDTPCRIAKETTVATAQQSPTC